MMFKFSSPFSSRGPGSRPGFTAGGAGRPGAGGAGFGAPGGRGGPQGGGRPSGSRGGHGGHGGHGGGGMARGGRMFEQGAIKLLALSLIAERPCHGYDLIKLIEGLVGGEYSPSPGVIYPTLSYLVDMGWASVSDSDGGRKLYTVTPEGQAQLDTQREELGALQERLRGLREGAGARRSPDIERAMGNLKAVLQTRLTPGAADEALTRRMAALIDEAALAIQKL